MNSVRPILYFMHASIFMLAILVSGCQPDEAEAVKPFSEADLDPLTDPELQLGLEIWDENCRTCHLPGKQHAPKIGNISQWEPRIANGEDELIRHAIEGYFSPSGNEMPPRGGNDDLSDVEVTAAVKYMIHRSR